MVELRLLGSTELKGADGREISGVLTRPKRLALLSYLALQAPGSYCRREKLVGLFWPESRESRARGGLSVILHHLRRLLGENVVVTRGAEEIGLNPNTIWVDTWEFVRASERGELEEAAELYRGPLLDGFHLAGAPGLDRLLEGRRHRLQKLALDLVDQLADRAPTHRARDARKWIEKACALAPLDNKAIHRLMLFEARNGHPATALKAYDAFVRRLRSELDADPLPDTAALAETIRAGGLEEADLGAPGRASEGDTRSSPQAVRERRIPAGVSRPGEKRASTPPNVEATVPEALEKVAADRLEDEPRRISIWRHAIVGGTLVLALLGIITIGWFLLDADPRGGFEVPAADTPASVAVLPFENLSRRDEDAVLADGMRAEILTQLGKIHSVEVKPLTWALGYRDSSDTSPPTIDEELGVRYVVEGELLRGGGTVRMPVRLVDRVTDKQLWSEVYDRDVSVESLLEIQREVALRVASAVDVEISPREIARLELEAPENLAAYRQYLEGVVAVRDISQGRGSRASLRAAEEHLEAAIAMEPKWAAPHAALGLALHFAASVNWDPARNYPRSKAALEEALRLDSLDARAWKSLGFVRWAWEDDFAGSEQAYLRSAELGGRPEWGYGLLLMSGGRYPEAIEQLERAVQRNPLSLIVRGQLGEANVCAERYGPAIHHLERARELIGSQARPLRGTSGASTERRLEELLPYAYVKDGRTDDALAMAEERARERSAERTVAALTFALAGMTERAQELLDDTERDTVSLRYTRSAVAAAVALGDRDAAMERLEWAAERVQQEGGDFTIGPLQCLEEVRSLAGDPRYERILRRVGWPERQELEERPRSGP